MSVVVSNQPSSISKIHKKLPFEDVEDTRRAIGRVLHTLRDTLSEGDSRRLTYQLSDDLLMIYVCAWRNNSYTTKIQHLDQLVNRVKNYDLALERSVFRTEVDVLKCTLLVLSELDENTDLLDYLPMSVQREIRWALIHPAA